MVIILVDSTCFIYEQKILKAMKHSQKILKKISKTYPGTDKMDDLWRKHTILWEGIQELFKLYKFYLDSDKK